MQRLAPTLAAWLAAAGSGPALGVLAVTLLAGCGASGAPPHVVVFVIDTLRADALGAYGAEGDGTPSFDALAAEGVLFESAYAPAPWTLPSTVSLLTSTLPCEHGVLADGDRIDGRVRTLAERLGEAGYESASFYANPYAGSVSGLDRGFDLHDQRSATHGEPVAEWLSQRTDPSAPFFLYVHNIEPHDPYEARSEVAEPLRHRVNRLLKRFRALTAADWRAERTPGATDNTADQRRLMGRLAALEPVVRELYRADVRLADRRLGSVVDALRARGVWEDTLLVVTSDHGEEFGEHGGWQHDQSLYEELVRVPLLIRLPGSRHGGRRVEAPVSLVDLVPTVLAQVGRPELAEGTRGRSLLPRIADDAGASEEGAPGRLAVRINRKKYYRPFHEQRGDRNVALREGRWKGIWYAEPRRFELFDLGRDPAETRDVSKRHPERVARWRREAEQVLAACDAERPARPGAAIDAESRHRLRALGYLD